MAETKVSTKHQVLRSFDAEGRTLQRGMVVDCSQWKHTAALVDRRYLAPFEGKPVTHDDQEWINDDRYLEHLGRQELLNPSPKKPMEGQEESNTKKKEST